MTDSNTPFPLPDTLPAMLSDVYDYWRGLIRGKASNMPYWDDVNLADLPSATGHLMLMTAFTKPERIRLDTVGKEISSRYGREIAGSFADEIDPKSPADFLLSQASATIESGAPSFYQSGSTARLLLPLWGDGHISMLLGVVAEV